MSFDDVFKNRLNPLIHAMPMNILIWGSGEGDPHYQKRCKIRKEIGARFPNSDVRFSEDLELQLSVAGSGQLRLHEQELWHLAACHVCVVLDTSQGVGEEISHFLNCSHAYKLMILTHERFQGRHSFPAEIRAAANQIFYTDAEFEQCTLVEKVATRVRQTALHLLTSLP